MVGGIFFVESEKGWLVLTRKVGNGVYILQDGEVLAEISVNGIWGHQGSRGAEVRIGMRGGTSIKFVRKELIDKGIEDGKSGKSGKS
jgi:sRNA-binding carbon storage regulator CsrA